MPLYVGNPVWIDITFSTGWSNYGAPFNNAQYCIDALGFVHFRGMCKSSSSTPPALIFTLPVGYRPDWTINFIVQAGNSNTAGGIFVNSLGEVRHQSAPNPQNFVSLEQVCFYVG